MTAWFTAAELATLNLPDLPGSERGIRKRAGRDGWPARTREASGGGREYSAADIQKFLPDAARAALLNHLVNAAPVNAKASVPAVTAKASAEIAASEAAPIDPTTLADWQRRCADARAAILQEVERLALVSGVDKAIATIIDLAARGELRPDLQELVSHANARRGKEGKRTLSRPTIYRWRADAEKGWTALAPLDPVKPQPVPEWAGPLLQLCRVPTKRSLAAIMDEIPARLPAHVPVPSYDQARRFLAKMSVVDRNRGRLGPNALLALQGFKRRSTEGLLPLQVVTADGHSFKADVAHPVHGKPFRPEVCAIMDTATRYVFGWSAGLAESSWVVMDTVRMGVERLGLFSLFYTDNGSGFVASAMTAEVTGLLARLGATPTNSIAGRAQARGKIERLQGSLWKAAARSLPTYSGRDMDNEARRKVVKLVDRDIKERGTSPLLMEWPEFLAWAQKEVDAYNARPHRSLPKIRDAETGKLRHMSPAECLADHRAQGWEPETLEPEILTDLFRPYEWRLTTRGEVKLPWGRYYHDSLVPFGGEKVRVGYDIHDGSRVWVRTAEDRLICIALRDANVIPEQPMSKIEHAQRQRVKRAVELRQRHIDDKMAELGPSLLEHKTEVPMSPMVAQHHAALVAEFEAELEAKTVEAKVVEIAPDHARFKRWLALQARIEAGQEVSDHDRHWFEVYTQQSEYRTTKMMFEEFGEQLFA